jgi:hypothetical protein
MRRSRFSNDQWFMFNVIVIAGAVAVAGLLIYLKDHLEWSWH